MLILTKSNHIPGPVLRGTGGTGGKKPRDVLRTLGTFSLKVVLKLPNPKDKKVAECRGSSQHDAYLTGCHAEGASRISR